MHKFSYRNNSPQNYNEALLWEWEKKKLLPSYSKLLWTNISWALENPVFLQFYWLHIIVVLALSTVPHGCHGPQNRRQRYPWQYMDSMNTCRDAGNEKDWWTDWLLLNSPSSGYPSLHTHTCCSVGVHSGKPVFECAQGRDERKKKSNLN